MSMTMRSKWSTLILLVAAILSPAIRAQPTPNLSGQWEGTLETPAGSLRLLLDVTRTTDGILLGALTSLDQGNARIPLDVVEVKGAAVHLEARVARGTFDGSFSADGKSIKGTWLQGVPLPLVLTRVAADGTSSSTSAPPTSGTPKPPASPIGLGLPLELRVPAPPVPFKGNQQTHLAYELHVTNFGPADVSLRRIEVLSGERLLAGFEGTELNACFDRWAALRAPRQRHPLTSERSDRAAASLLSCGSRWRRKRPLPPGCIIGSRPMPARSTSRRSTFRRAGRLPSDRPFAGAPGLRRMAPRTIPRTGKRCSRSWAVRR
jgi:hypothetical protein